MSKTKRKQRNRNTRKVARLKFIYRYDLTTLRAFRRVHFERQSNATVRGVIKEYRDQGLIGDHNMPGHNGEKYYFLRPKGARLIGVNTKKTRETAFQPRALYERYARLLFCTQCRIKLGTESPRMFRPSEFRRVFPQLAEGAPNMYYAQDQDRNILALYPVALPDTRRLVATLHKKFRALLEHEQFRKLIAAERFKLTVIVPSDELSQAITAENLLRETRLQDAAPQKRKQLEFLERFRRTLVIWSSEDLGKLL